MFRLISARKDFWRYQTLLHFAYMETAAREIIQLGSRPSDTLLTSFAATAARAAEWELGIVAVA
jgi:hypothetical protein